MSADVTPPSDAGAAPAVPHCYRHRDRETYVSCVRCGRPICPECMRPASVGFQCPEELAGGGRPSRTSGRASGGGAAGSGTSVGGSNRPRRAALGGRVDGDQRPYATQALIVLCVLGYLLQGAPGLGLQSTVHYNTFTTAYWLDGYAIADQHQYYRLLTAAFLHANLLHIGLNMLALYLLGSQLEIVLGRVRFLALFVVCAVGGNTLSFVVHGRNIASLGASTAIFGFFATYYLVARRMRVDTSQILVVVGLNLAITFFWSNIDKFGHIGGLVTGLVVGAIYVWVPARKPALQAAGVLGVFALLVVAVALRVHSLQTPSF